MEHLLQQLVEELRQNNEYMKLLLLHVKPSYDRREVLILLGYTDRSHRKIIERLEDEKLLTRISKKPIKYSANQVNNLLEKVRKGQVAL